MLFLVQILVAVSLFVLVMWFVSEDGKLVQACKSFKPVQDKFVSCFNESNMVGKVVCVPSWQQNVSYNGGFGNG